MKRDSEEENTPRKSSTKPPARSLLKLIGLVLATILGMLATLAGAIMLAAILQSRPFQEQGSNPEFWMGFGILVVGLLILALSTCRLVVALRPRETRRR